MKEHEFSDFFLSHLLTRTARYEEDLIDQLFNSSEKRLARILLLMAEFGKPGEPETFIPSITQETLADMKLQCSCGAKYSFEVTPDMQASTKTSAEETYQEMSVAT